MLREVEGVRINVLDEGSGLAIVFLHGLGGCWRDWEPELDSLSDRYRSTECFDTHPPSVASAG